MDAAVTALSYPASPSSRQQLHERQRPTANFRCRTETGHQLKGNASTAGPMPVGVDALYVFAGIYVFAAARNSRLSLMPILADPISGSISWPELTNSLDPRSKYFAQSLKTYEQPLRARPGGTWKRRSQRLPCDQRPVRFLRLPALAQSALAPVAQAAPN